MFITKFNFSFLICFLISFSVSSQNDTTSGWKIYSYPSGKQSSTGYIEKGKPIGKWTNFYESGQIKSEGNWKSNGLDSIWLFYSIEGKISRSISFAYNLKNGRYLVYDSVEMIQFDGFYVNDTLQGLFKRFQNGKLIEEGNYLKGELDGLLREYDANTGRLLSIKDLASGEIEDEKRINRMINDKKEGLWQNFDDDGRLLSQETYINGVLQKDDSNPNVSIDFETEFHKNGQLKSEYVLLDEMKSGVKSNFDENGARLISEVFEKDILIANGWFNQEGLKDSIWQNFYPDGALLSKGKFKGGKKEGQWIYYFTNSSVEQKGWFKDNLPSGQWTWYYPNGQIRRSEGFYRGKYQGDIIDYDTEGKIIQKQTYAYNELEGEYYYFIGDHQEKGKMQNSLREGKWVYHHANGKKSFVGKYKDGLAQGKHKYWFENGNRSFNISYQRGKLHGKKMEFYERGGLMHTYIYKNGKLFSIDQLVLQKDKILID